ncbi:hypothetical protein RhiLY_04645 [Ceratobasidium sp. AG-Ba]|nr:hypothetical protein RhiLY_04645 [Ceratobasidium sp. AG-Ba]
MSSMDTPASPQTTNEDAPLASPSRSVPENENGKSDGTDKLTFSEQQPTSELVSKAQAFLESPELKGNDADSKTQFLVTKGIPAETADELQKALASIPVIPARTYPEALVAPPRSRLFENLVTLYYFFAYAAGGSAVLTFAYSKFILPRWSRMLVAKHRLRKHQLGLLQRLTTELKAHKGKSLTADSVAPTSESKEPISSTKLQQLRAQVSDIGPKTNRQHTLQSLSDLTGYLSSQYHITSGLSSAMRSYNFQFAMPGATPNSNKDDIHNDIKKDLRSLKGLLINRRTFLQGSSVPRPVSVERVY